MTDSQRTIAARVVRIFACLVTLWAVLLLIDSDRTGNDGFGYVMLVVGPLIMLSARWIDPPNPTNASSSSENPAASADEKAPGAVGQEAASEPASNEPV